MSKNQANEGSVWIIGKHPVASALSSGKRSIYQIFVTKSSYEYLKLSLKPQILNKIGNKIKIVETSLIESIIKKDSTHQGIIANCSKLKTKSESDLFELLNKSEEKPNLLILDQLTDPQNIGAIYRSACAFRMKNIVIPENNFSEESSSLIKASVGAIEKLNIYKVINLNKLLEKLKKQDYWCAGLDGAAKSDISDLKNYSNIALIIGSEGKGIRPLIKKNCDFLVKIKIQEVESLNASNACAIALYELTRGKIS